MTLLLHELQQMQQKKKKKKSSFKQEAHHRTFPSKTFLTQTLDRDGSAPVALPSSTTGAWTMGSRGHKLPELARTLGNPKPKTSFSLGFFLHRNMPGSQLHHPHQSIVSLLWFQHLNSRGHEPPASQQAPGTAPPASVLLRLYCIITNDYCGNIAP